MSVISARINPKAGPRKVQEAVLSQERSKPFHFEFWLLKVAPAAERIIGGKKKAKLN